MIPRGSAPGLFIVAGINAIINAWLIESVPSICKSQIFSTQKTIKAGRITLTCGDNNETADLIVTDDKIKVFYTNEKGIVNELQTLAKYNPRTRKFTSYT